jgi:hypothetical protein
MFIFSRMHCVCKQKQIYFFPFGARITDVLVLCVLYFPQMQHTEELWLYMGTVSGGNDGRRYISVHDLCSWLSNITCQILPSLHALIECDTISAFFRIRNKYVYKTDMGTTQCSLSFVHNKYNACIQIYLYNLISDLAKKELVQGRCFPLSAKTQGQSYRWIS